MRPLLLEKIQVGVVVVFLTLLCTAFRANAQEAPEALRRQSVSSGRLPREQAGFAARSPDDNLFLLLELRSAKGVTRALPCIDIIKGEFS